VGRALSPEEQRRLLEAVDTQTHPNRSRTLGTFVRLALLTGMRSGKVQSLQWERLMPMNAPVPAVMEQYAAWYAGEFGPLRPEWCCFPFGKPYPTDPTRPITDITGAWVALRKRAKAECRPDDLRHTGATRMAEAGVAKSTMLALLGHMSQRMIERYSHIRMPARREAMESITLPKGFETTKMPPTKPPTMQGVGWVS
jgi:integrase